MIDCSRQWNCYCQLLLNHEHQHNSGTRFSYLVTNLISAQQTRRMSRRKDLLSRRYARKTQSTPKNKRDDSIRTRHEDTGETRHHNSGTKRATDLALRPILYRVPRMIVHNGRLYVESLHCLVLKLYGSFSFQIYVVAMLCLWSGLGTKTNW